MNSHASLRRTEIAIDHDLFGFGSEVTGKLNDISAVRVGVNGMRSYLPEYTRNMNDAISIIKWCRSQGGNGYLWTVGDGWKCRLTFEGQVFEGIGDHPEMAICNTAILLCEWRKGKQ